MDYSSNFDKIHQNPEKLQIIFQSEIHKSFSTINNKKSLPEVTLVIANRIRLAEYDSKLAD